MELKVGAAYVRVSTDDQLEYSPDSQLKVIREYAKRENYIIPDEYIYREEDGISGKSADKRPQFRLMIATAKQDNPPFDSIFVWKYSRFARNQEEAIMYKNLLKKKGITVKSISEPSSDSPFASLIERIIEWMDEYYLINLASEVRRGKTEKASRGEYAGLPPFGYDLKNKTLVPNDKAEIVRYIFDCYASGEAPRAIAERLGKIGIRTRKGKVPEVRFVQYILQNHAYIGEVRYSTEGQGNYLYPERVSENVMTVQANHEPIVNKDVWDAAQKRLSRKKREMNYIRYERPDGFMLKGIVRCGDCGATLVYSVGKTISLQCHNYNKGKCHVSHSISLKRANEAVLSGLEECLHNTSFKFAPKPPKKNTIKHDWDNMIQSEEAKLKRAKHALLEGAFDTNEYQEIKAEIEDTIARLKAAKASEEANNRPALTTEELKEKTLSVLEILRSPDISEKIKNEALRSILERIVYKKPENVFEFHFFP